MLYENRLSVVQIDIDVMLLNAFRSSSHVRYVCVCVAQQKRTGVDLIGLMR